MKSAIFLRELRIGLLQELALVGTLFCIWITAGWLAASVYRLPVRELREEILLLLVLLVALLAFSSGARTFTAESRRRQEMFFFSLPISRRSLWLSVIGGRLMAAFPVPALLVLANFLLWEGLPGLRNLGAGGLAIFMALFASGCCLSLLFRRDMAAYFAGALLVSPVVAQSLALTTSGFSDGSLRYWLSTLSVGLLATVFLVLSWFFFQRGEVQIRTRQLTNAMLLGVVLAVVLLLTGTVTQSPLLDKFAEPWTQNPHPWAPPPAWATFPARLVSPGGRYLAVAEALSGRPGISRVTIVETATGRRVGERRWRDLRSVGWDGEEEVLRILCSDSAIPFFWRMIEGEAATEWIRLTPDGRELTRSRLWQMHTAVPPGDGSDLLTNQRSDTSRLILLNEPGRLPVLAKGTWSGDLTILLLLQDDGGYTKLYDRALKREIPLPGCDHGRSAELISTPSSLALLARFQCHSSTASGPMTIQYRHFFYFPGSGSAKPIPALDPVLDNQPIFLAYLDERTAIWRPKGEETWKILQDGQIRTLWPLQ